MRPPAQRFGDWSSAPYAVANYRRFHEAQAKHNDPYDADSSDEEAIRRSSNRHNKKKHVAYRQAWDAFLKLLDGRLLGGALVHHSKAGDGPIEELRSTAVTLTLALVYAFQPGVPTSGKWTKLGPDLDVHVVGTCCTDIIPKAWKLSYSKMKAPAQGDDKKRT